MNMLPLMISIMVWMRSKNKKEEKTRVMMRDKSQMCINIIDTSLKAYLVATLLIV